MPLTMIPTQEETLIWELESDLPSVACHAAMELDNLSLGVSKQLKSVERLINLLPQPCHTLAQCSTLDIADPSTVVVIKRAIDDYSLMNASLLTVNDLINEAGRIRQSLEDLLHTMQPNINEVERLRSFCLALSKSASAYEQSIEDMRPSHPFRGMI